MCDCVSLLSHVPVAGSPTMTMTILSEAVVPVTSRGAAFSPSGKRCGMGLSMFGGGRKRCDDNKSETLDDAGMEFNDDMIPRRRVRLYVGARRGVDGCGRAMGLTEWTPLRLLQITSNNDNKNNSSQ
jgi:hypothetical protein